MGRRFRIRVGDTTTRGGRVSTGLSTVTWHGHALGFEGDRVKCRGLWQFGDPIHAGPSQRERKRQQTRHLDKRRFHCAHVVQDNPCRWNSPARELVDQGLR